MTDAAVLLDRTGLDAMIGALGADRTVIGPVRRGDVIVPERIDGVDDFPRGWTEEREAATSGHRASGDGRHFAFCSPADSWRRWLFPPRTLLVTIRRPSGRGGELEVDEAPPAHRDLALFGIRACDLAALAITDRVFAGGDHPDPHYVGARDGAFIVAVGCSRSAPTCFCVSQGEGPRPGRGYDVLLTELPGPDGWDPEDVAVLAEARSPRGEHPPGEGADRTGAPGAAEPDRRAAVAVTDGAAAAQHRRIDPGDLARLALAEESHGWADVAERCLSCTNCTLVCPTCFCSTVEDSSDLAGTTAERWRRWDSCFADGHSYIHGGPVRATVASRYRQWLLHKLVTWHDQFDSTGCTGCGRCITWCPPGIDLTAEVARIASTVEGS